jgi:hypothetical protein
VLQILAAVNEAGPLDLAVVARDLQQHPLALS